MWFLFKVAETLSELYRAREVRKMIVVAIVPVNRENGKSPSAIFSGRIQKTDQVSQNIHTRNGSLNDRLADSIYMPITSQKT